VVRHAVTALATNAIRDQTPRCRDLPAGKPLSERTRRLRTRATPPVDRVRPGGRSERVREAVLLACLELLTEGVVELPVAEVAERSGVNRATVYRWWPTQTALLNDALTFHTRSRMEAPDTGTWAGDVRGLMTQVAGLLDEPVERAFIATMATRRYPAFNELMRTSQRRALPGWQAMVARAVDRGEVSRSVNAGAILSMIISPLVTISLFEERPVTAREIGVFVELICRATTPATGKSSPAVRKQGERSARGSTTKATARTAASGKGAGVAKLASKPAMPASK
jgi:AcrR family transcriptional regulator